MTSYPGACGGWWGKSVALVMWLPTEHAGHHLLRNLDLPNPFPLCLLCGSTGKPASRNCPCMGPHS